MMVALLLTAPCAGAQTSDIDSTIHTLEQALVEAMHAKDRQRLDELLSVDYVLRGAPDIDRATWIRNALALCWGDRGDIDGFHTTRQGDVIIASFELTFYVDPGTCRPARLGSLITDIWVREEAGWRLRLRHSGPTPAPGSPISAQFGIVPQTPPAWEMTGELSVLATSGNTSTNTMGLSATAIHRRGASTSRASVDFVRNEVDGIARAQSFSAQLRHGRQIGAKLEMFAQAGYSQDRFAGIDSRTSVEGGVSYIVSLPAPHTLAAEGGVGFTAERRVGAADLEFATASSAVEYAWRLPGRLEFSERVEGVADLETLGNWRSRTATALTVALTRVLSLKTSHNVDFRNSPVAGFGRTDMRTAVALVFSFQ